ncbi:MAG: hypothetical protein RL347_2025 [Actinomycetota bacterium]|jgi:hypothetical protein
MADAWDDVTPAGHAWESIAPGPELAQLIAAIDPHSLDASARVSYLQATDRLIGWAHVQQARALVAVDDAVREATSPGPGMSTSQQASYVADEVAAALHVAARTATTKVNAALAILRDWPRLGEAVESGALTVAQAREIYEGVHVLSGQLDEDGLDLSERAVVGLIRIAGGLSPARLRERVARMVASLDPEAAARRRRRSVRDLTDVSIWAEPDGMACLAARGLSIDAIALHDLISARAKAMREAACPDEDRTMGQWRYAALLAAFGLAPVGMPVTRTVADAMTGDTATDTPAPVVDPVRPQVRVVIPLDTLLGLAQTPGEVEGYGPIDPELARTLAADADWVRWVTDGVGDVLIDEGRRRFPGARLARFLRARDRLCKHPSCGVRSRNCDADHLPVSYAEGGRTSAMTMAPTCPRHNRHREASGWTLTDDRPHDPLGSPDPTWISPLGRRYQSPPPRPLINDSVPRRT